MSECTFRNRKPVPWDKIFYFVLGGWIVWVTWASFGRLQP